MNPAAQKGVFSDGAFANVALWPYVNAGVNAGIPVGQYGEKSDGNLIRGIGTGQPVKSGPQIAAGFARNQAQGLGEGLKASIPVASQGNQFQ